MTVVYETNADRSTSSALLVIMGSAVEDGRGGGSMTPGEGGAKDIPIVLGASVFIGLFPL